MTEVLFVHLNINAAKKWKKTHFAYLLLMSNIFSCFLKPFLQIIEILSKSLFLLHQLLRFTRVCGKQADSLKAHRLKCVNVFIGKLCFAFSENKTFVTSKQSAYGKWIWSVYQIFGACKLTLCLNVLVSLCKTEFLL